MDAAELIRDGAAFLGIELGSTRIKASLIAPDSTALASGSHTWENRLEDGVWTYPIEDVWAAVTEPERLRSRDFVDAVALAVEHFVDPEVREGEIPLLGFLDRLLLSRLVQQIPEPVSDHGSSPFDFGPAPDAGKQGIP